MNKEQHDTNECKHGPIESANKWKVFFKHLLCKEKYYFRNDSSAICARCGAHIRTPKFFRSPLFMLIYGIAVFLITIGVWWPLLKTQISLILLLLLFVLAWVFFDRVLIAAIFTFGKWPKDEDMGNCTGKDAIWSKTRIVFGCFCSHGAMLLMMVLMNSL